MEKLQDTQIKYGPYTGNNHSIESISEEAQTLNLLAKDFKSAILIMFKQLKNAKST